MMASRQLPKTLPALIPAFFLCAFFVAPLIVLFWISIHEPSSSDLYGTRLTADNYFRLLTTPYYHTLLWRTITSGVVVLLACLLIGYPMAAVLTSLPRRWRLLAITLLFFALMVSNVIRVYGWIAIIGRRGLINSALQGAGFIERPLNMLYTFEAVTIALLTILLPYTVISIANVLDSIDPRYAEAAKSLRAGPVRTFLKVTWPLSLPGVASGLSIVFLLTLSAYVTITLVGGARFKLLVSAVYDSSLTFNWPGAAAAAFVLLVVGLIGVGLIYLLLRPHRARGHR